MLALLSSPIRRWLLAAVLVPVVAWVLARLGRFLQRRNGGDPTRSSRLLMKASSGLRRLTRGRSDDEEHGPHESPRARTA